MKIRGMCMGNNYRSDQNIPQERSCAAINATKIHIIQSSHHLSKWGSLALQQNSESQILNFVFSPNLYSHLQTMFWMIPSYPYFIPLNQSILLQKKSIVRVYTHIYISGNKNAIRRYDNTQ